ncbi:MAG TPA: hypothetical protein VJU61_10510, partial [Polyangiaceae bacterium]|nr:hypothetical protein [Polyangiaceae bacterium]
MKYTYKIHYLPWLLGASALGAGCSDAATPSAAPAPEGALYAVFTSVETDEYEATYLGLTPSLEGAAELDTASALEAPGGSRFYAPRSGGFFAIGSNDDFTVTRYDLGPDGSLVETNRMSFAGIGVTRLQNRVVFVDETKAYYIDETAGQIAIWNPTAMTLEGTFRLPEPLADGYDGYSTDLPFGRFPLVDGRLFIPVAWYNFEAGTAREVTGLAIVDTTTDSVSSYTETERCAAATELAFDDNGDVYYGTGVNYPFYAHANDPDLRTATQPGCILRVRAGQQEFDPDYLLRVTQLTGGGTGMGLTDAATPGTAYVQVLDESLLPWAEIQDEDTFWEEPAWNWWRVDLRAAEAVIDNEIPASTPYMTSYEVDGRRYVAQQAENNRSRLYELSATGA